MDRVEMLDVGADDCLTGGVDVRELAARIRHAIEAGADLRDEGGITRIERGV